MTGLPRFLLRLRPLPAFRHRRAFLRPAAGLLVSSLASLGAGAPARAQEVPRREAEETGAGRSPSFRWTLDSTEDWQEAAAESEGLRIEDGLALPEGKSARLRSVVRRFERRLVPLVLVVEPSPLWENWIPVPNIGPSNLRDAPVLLNLGAEGLWMFGLYGEAKKREGFQAEPATLEGFEGPLWTTPFPDQFDAPGGLQPGLGGYHAWQTRDLVHWVHHGPVTEAFSRWVTSAEAVDGRVYLYYDYPNDQDPHLYIDEDLRDGRPGRDLGLAFADPSDGSDAGVIRDLEGRFHLIYEDWTPINARKHSWDSPLAGHAVSEDGLRGWRILPPAVDRRTRPTGETGTYLHPHWTQHPDWDSNVATYQVHEPEQDAFGDWAAIGIGGRSWLFADYEPVDGGIRLAWFTSPDLATPFTLCGAMGKGHPDPDVAFFDGRFILVTQLEQDWVSPGPWVERVTARAGVDTDGDGALDAWTDWKELRETYRLRPGFSKQVLREPASLDLQELPAGFGFAFELRLEDTTENRSRPLLDRLEMRFAEGVQEGSSRRR